MLVTCRNGGTERIPIEQADLFLVQLSSKCDIGSDPGLLAREVQRWKNEWKGYFLARGLAIMPYDSQQERAMQRANAALLSCWYSETKHIGSWLVSEETTRDYCHLEPFTRCCLCPHLRLSLFEFAISLVSHPQVSGLPYLAVLACILGGLVFLVRKLVKQGALREFIQPRVSTVVLTVICAMVFIWWFIASLIDLIGWIILAYLLASSIMYAKKKRRAVEASSNEH